MEQPTDPQGAYLASLADGLAPAVYGLSTDQEWVQFGRLACMASTNGQTADGFASAFTENAPSSMPDPMIDAIATVFTTATESAGFCDTV
ncbi:hypothetical protein [Blastococcus sp. SYSU DS0973]